MINCFNIEFPNNVFSKNFVKLYFCMGQSSNVGLRTVTIRPLVFKIHTHAPARTRTRDL